MSNIEHNFEHHTRFGNNCSKAVLFCKGIIASTLLIEIAPGGVTNHVQLVQPVIVPSVKPSVPIKEGMVEKRGHSAKYLMFSR